MVLVRTRVLIRRKREAGGCLGEGPTPPLPALEWRRDPGPGVWPPLLAGEGEEPGSSLELPEEIRPHRHLDFIPMTPILDF